MSNNNATRASLCERQVTVKEAALQDAPKRERTTRQQWSSIMHILSDQHLRSYMQGSIAHDALSPDTPRFRENLSSSTSQDEGYISGDVITSKQQPRADPFDDSNIFDNDPSASPRLNVSDRPADDEEFGDFIATLLPSTSTIASISPGPSILTKVKRSLSLQTTQSPYTALPSSSDEVALLAHAPEPERDFFEGQGLVQPYYARYDVASRAARKAARQRGINVLKRLQRAGKVAGEKLSEVYAGALSGAEMDLWKQLEGTNMEMPSTRGRYTGDGIVVAGSKPAAAARSSSPTPSATAAFSEPGNLFEDTDVAEEDEQTQESYSSGIIRPVYFSAKPSPHGTKRHGKQAAGEILERVIGEEVEAWGR